MPVLSTAWVEFENIHKEDPFLQASIILLQRPNPPEIEIADDVLQAADSWDPWTLGHRCVGARPSVLMRFGNPQQRHEFTRTHAAHVNEKNSGLHQSYQNLQGGTDIVAQSVRYI